MCDLDFCVCSQKYSKWLRNCGLQDDEEPADEAYKADGAYIPRIFFTGMQTQLTIKYCKPRNYTQFTDLKKERLQCEQFVVCYTDLAGKVDHDIYNEGGNPKYKYYYSNPESSKLK